MKNGNGVVRYVNFSDLEEIFIRHTVWSDEWDLAWYEYAWHVFSEENKIRYTDDMQRATIVLQAYALIVIYVEFCHIAFGMPMNKDFSDWEDESGISTFLLGRLVQETLEDKDVPEDEAFNILVDEMRSTVMGTLFGKAGFRDEVHLLVSMFASSPELEYEYDTDKLEEDPASYKRYELLERIVDENYSEILENISSEMLEVYSWLSQGSHQIR